MQQPADPVRYCTGIGLSRPSWRSIARLVGRIDEAAGVEQDVGDVARRQAQQHEDDHRDAEQGHQHQAEAPHQIGAHRLPP